MSGSRVDCHGIFLEVRADLNRFGITDHKSDDVLLINIDPTACLLTYYSKSVKALEYQEPVFNIKFDDIMGGDVFNTSPDRFNLRFQKGKEVLIIPHVMVGNGGSGGHERDIFVLYLNSLKYVNEGFGKSEGLRVLDVSNFFLGRYFKYPSHRVVFDVDVKKKGFLSSDDRRLILTPYSIIMLKDGMSRVPVHVFPILGTNSQAKSSKGIEFKVVGSTDSNTAKLWKTEGYDVVFEFKNSDERNQWLSTIQTLVSSLRSLPIVPPESICKEAQQSCKPKKSTGPIRPSNYAGGRGIQPSIHDQSERLNKKALAVPQTLSSPAASKPLYFDVPTSATTTPSVSRKSTYIGRSPSVSTNSNTSHSTPQTIVEHVQPQSRARGVASTNLSFKPPISARPSNLTATPTASHSRSTSRTHFPPPSVSIRVDDHDDDPPPPPPMTCSSPDAFPGPPPDSPPPSSPISPIPVAPSLPKATYRRTVKVVEEEPRVPEPEPVTVIPEDDDIPPPPPPSEPILSPPIPGMSIRTSGSSMSSLRPGSNLVSPVMSLPPSGLINSSSVPPSPANRFTQFSTDIMSSVISPPSSYYKKNQLYQVMDGQDAFLGYLDVNLVLPFLSSKNATVHAIRPDLDLPPSYLLTSSGILFDIKPNDSVSKDDFVFVIAELQKDFIVHNFTYGSAGNVVSFVVQGALPGCDDELKFIADNSFNNKIYNNMASTFSLQDKTVENKIKKDTKIYVYLGTNPESIGIITLPEDDTTFAQLRALIIDELDDVPEYFCFIYQNAKMGLKQELKRFVHELEENCVVIRSVKPKKPKAVEPAPPIPSRPTISPSTPTAPSIDFNAPVQAQRPKIDLSGSKPLRSTPTASSTPRSAGQPSFMDAIKAGSVTLKPVDLSKGSTLPPKEESPSYLDEIKNFKKGITLRSVNLEEEKKAREAARAAADAKNNSGFLNLRNILENRRDAVADEESDDDCWDDE